MSQNIIALLVIGFFMIFPLVIGFAARSKSQATAEDYFIQSRGMGAVAVFFSVAATWWSAFAFLGSNGYFYTGTAILDRNCVEYPVRNPVLSHW